MLRAVVDTNVIYSALYSNTGASNELLRLFSSKVWKLVLSNTICVKYEEVLRRKAKTLFLTQEEISQIIDGICARAERFHLKGPWIPILNDPDDEAQVHLAFEAATGYIVTHNTKHLRPARAIGVKVLTPREFLDILTNRP